MIEHNIRIPRLSLVFVNYRSIFHLSQSLRSLEKEPSSQQEREIIVVNQDVSERKAMEMFAKQRGFRLIHRENLGFASGANAGAAVATGAYLAFLNPDTYYSSGSFEEILQIFEVDDHVGLVGATLCDADGHPEKWSKGRFLTLSRLVMNNIIPEAFFPKRGIDWVSGGALFIRKSLFHSLCGFSEDFFLYFEDMDFCARVRQAGYSVQSSQSLQFTHAGGKSCASKSIRKKHFFDSQRRYFRKHRPFWEQRVHFFLQGIKIW
ncbi:MAG: glycosyltransferase family 2 protein [Candidatus Moraniibacteriota bacterium]